MMQGSSDVERGAALEGEAPRQRAPEAGTSSLALGAYLSSRQARVDALLHLRLEELSTRVSPLLRKALRSWLLDGGTRIRPVLCLALAEAVTGARAPDRVVEDAACALELIHTCALLHEERPTWTPGALHPRQPPHAHMPQEAISLQACDALLVEAFRLVARGPEPVRSKLCRELAAGTGMMGHADEHVPDIAEDRAARQNYLIQLHGMKGRGFIRASCRIGAIAAGASRDALRRADAYGDAVGLAFLIADDMRDATSDEGPLRAPAGTDTVVGRISFATVLGLETSWAIANKMVAQAVAVIEPLEGQDGPLAAIARYALER